jgi:hypothetical protein
LFTFLRAGPVRFSAMARRYLLPIMIVLVLSKIVGDHFNISLYDMHVEFKCIPFVEDLPPRGMEQLVAADVMSTNVVMFHEIMAAREVYTRLLSCGHNGFPVVTAESKVTGVVLRSHLLHIMRLGSFCTAEGQPLTVSTGGAGQEGELGGCGGAAGGRQIVYDDLAVSLESELPCELSDIPEESLEGAHIDMRAVMNPWPHVVFEGASLSRVFRLYHLRNRSMATEILDWLRFTYGFENCGFRNDVTEQVPRPRHPTPTRHQRGQRGGGHALPEGASHRLERGQPDLISDRQHLV